MIKYVVIIVMWIIYKMVMYTYPTIFSYPIASFITVDTITSFLFVLLSIRVYYYFKKYDN
ncbi:hypothetical protein CJ205_04960 [Dolosicoccus paucivorans]|uniref:Uncharacterized protein n=1 Tax=Dolosicoccus paucivorans TaxID=84521 RepID=A0A2N6SMP4_9LACT|nr:hypothetical protein [Dolosicoccus paucivorans]PMB84061.1 hypothetical protein CJ206_05750 [Dolosicoccus paucivorans]PMC58332.1 hypothetical protein CJ205_04960 [Dolosicoccus paucivorans]